MNAPDSRWLLRQAGWMLLAALVLLAIFENTTLDITLEAYFFDPATRRFPAQYQWFYSNFMHHALKTASLALGISALAVCAFGARGWLNWLPPRNAWLAGLGMILIPLLTTALKQVSNRHCPWDVVDFGGYAPYVHLFATTPDNVMHGVCFPAGHASAGFVWIIWALALRPTRPRAAMLALVGGLLAGALMGYGRMAQGAHFPSHVLWSAWLAWAVALALAFLLRARVAVAAAPELAPC